MTHICCLVMNSASAKTATSHCLSCLKSIFICLLSYNPLHAQKNTHKRVTFASSVPSIKWWRETASNPCHTVAACQSYCFTTFRRQKMQFKHEQYVINYDYFLTTGWCTMLLSSNEQSRIRRQINKDSD